MWRRLGAALLDVPRDYVGRSNTRYRKSANWNGPASGLAAAEAFEFGGGPGDRLVDRLTAHGAFGDHLRSSRLRVDLVGDLGGGWAVGDHHLHIPARRIVVDRAPWRAFLGPGLEVVQPLKGRYVVAVARRHRLLDRGALAQEGQEALCRRFVGREFPGGTEERHRRVEASLRTLRRWKSPQLLGDLRRVAHRHRPGRR